jgi:hypothetical protein
VISQQEPSGDEEGRLTYLWLIVMVFMFMLHELYTLGVYPPDKSKRSAARVSPSGSEARGGEPLMMEKITEGYPLWCLSPGMVSP